MPRKYKSKKAMSTKKSYGKKRYLANNSLTRVNLGLGFPKTVKVVHKYRTIQSLSVIAGGALGKYTMAANGMFDPDISSVGHQPMYFDQFSGLYNHYVVIGSKINIHLMSSTQATVPIAFALFNNDDLAILPANLSGVAEQSLSRTVVLPTGGSQTRRLTLNWSAKKNFGSGVLANTDLQGTSSANPSELSYFDLYYQAADLVTAISFIADISIEYIAVWKELKDVQQS